jgi:Zn-dependent oligopeptidase
MCRRVADAQYFSLGHCMDGLNTIVSSLFGLSLEVVPMDRTESWHPSVRYVRTRPYAHD